MNHKRQSHYFCIALISTCLVSAQCMAAAEDDPDRIMTGCIIKHRDTTLGTDGTYKRAFVSEETNSNSGKTGDIRLYYNSTKLNRQTFSLTWLRYDSQQAKNLWFISPQHTQACMQNQLTGVNAATCSDFKYVYLQFNDGYYVISDYSGGGNAWKAPADSNGTGFISSENFSSTATLTVRRRFHWDITGCKNLLGSGMSPAP